MTDWVIPPTDELNYGVVNTDDYTLSIYTECCEAVLLLSTSAAWFGECGACGKEYHLAYHKSLEKEGMEYQLYWGQYATSKVEQKIHEWITYYFGKKDYGILFGGKHWTDADW